MQLNQGKFEYNGNCGCVTLFLLRFAQFHGLPCLITLNADCNVNSCKLILPTATHNSMHIDRLIQLNAYVTSSVSSLSTFHRKLAAHLHVHQLSYLLDFLPSFIVYNAILVLEVFYSESHKP